jgi:hypothetical protein
LHDAYKKAALKSHSDAGGNDAEFRRAHEAYKRIGVILEQRVPPKVANKYEDAQKPDSDNPGSEVDVNK